MPAELVFKNGFEIDNSEYKKDTEGLSIHSCFSPIIPTTFGLNGHFSNVSFNEEKSIKFPNLLENNSCIRVVCNYGDIKTQIWDQLLTEGKININSEKNSFRNRERRQKRAKLVGLPLRKQQGNGSCFNSSILIWVHSQKFQVTYKVRIFRNGNFGLPGIKPEYIDDIIELLRTDVTKFLNKFTGHTSITLSTISSIMKNRKWSIKLQNGQQLDLLSIMTEINKSNPPFPMSYVQLHMGDNKLSMQFNIDGHKCLINTFIHGKINMLGYCDPRHIQIICQYIQSIFITNII
jgi:hypothetical protein